MQPYRKVYKFLQYIKVMTTDTIIISRFEYDQMRQEIKTLRNTKVYQRLLEFEDNIARGRRFTRKDLGF